MKAQTFKIVGDSRFFPQIKEDLITFGYRFHNSSYDGKFIMTNVCQMETSTKEEFKVLYQTDYDDNLKKEIFTLPEDYNKALEFAKEQLKDEYWREELKHKEIVTSISGGIGEFKTGILNLKGNYKWEVLGKDGKRLPSAYGAICDPFEFFRKATPEEIEEYNRIDWKVGDIATFTYSQIAAKIESLGTTGADLRFKDGSHRTVDLKGIIKPTPEQIEEFNKPVYKAGDWAYIIAEDRAFEIGFVGSNGNGLDLLGGHRSITDMSKVRLATPEEIKKANEPKDGDIVVSTGDENGTCHLPIGTIGKVGVTEDKEWYYVTEKNGKKSYNNGIEWLGSYFRKATKEEIAEFNKKPEYIEMTVGSKNAKVKVYKNKVEIVATRANALSMSKLRDLVNNYRMINVTLGDYFANSDITVRHIRIGCESENNLVSLNEIKSVIDMANSL